MILLLLAAWAVVLVPSLGFRKLSSSPIDGVRRFERSMGVLASARTTGHIPGRWIMVPGSNSADAPRRRRNRVVRRRRQTFLRLLMASASTLLLGALPGLHSILYMHLLVDVVLVAYVVQLRRWAMAEAQRRRVVRHLPAEPQPAQPVLEASSPLDAELLSVESG